MAHIGDILKEMKTKINLQYLSSSLIGVKDKKLTKDTEVTFATQEICATDVMNNGSKTAVIIWVDVDDFNRSMQELNNGKPTEAN